MQMEFLNLSNKNVSMLFKKKTKHHSKQAEHGYSVTPKDSLKVDVAVGQITALGWGCCDKANNPKIESLRALDGHGNLSRGTGK